MFGSLIESTRQAPPEFDAWVAPHVAVMRRLATTIAPELDSEDIVQEALLRAWQKRDTYKAELGTARTWLLALTRDRVQRTRIRGRDRFTLLRSGDPVTETAASVAGGDVDLRAAIANLPRRQREVVVLFYYVDLTVEETARVLDCAPGTVKSTLADARVRLGRVLGNTHD